MMEVLDELRTMDFLEVLAVVTLFVPAVGGGFAVNFFIYREIWRGVRKKRSSRQKSSSRYGPA